MPTILRDIQHPLPNYAKSNPAASFTDTGIDIGEASPDRIVAVAISSYNGSTNPSVSAVTIGGIAATLIKGGTSRRAACVAYANVPTGTTADIAITTTSAVESIVIDVFPIYGCSGLYTSGTATRTTTGTKITVSGLNAPTDCVVLGVAMIGSDTSVSWSGNVVMKTNREAINTSFSERHTCAAGVQDAALVSGSFTVTHGSTNNAAMTVAIFY